MEEINSMKKQISLSMKRLYLLAMKYAKTNDQMEEISDFLKYVFEHKNDDL